MNAPGYAELHCLSDFSFGRGASSAREVFERAKRCGYSALAITDECSLAGIVRAHEAARETGVKLIVGTEIRLEDGAKLVLLVENQDGYPAELVPEGHTPTTWLRALTEQGLRWRWPDGKSVAVRAQVEHELALIAELR